MTSADTEMPARGLVLSVGQSPEQTQGSLTRVGAGRAVFFLSAETLETFERDLRPRLESCGVESFEMVTTPDAQDLEICLAALLADLPRALRRLELEWHEVAIDFTGATKAMSAALVLATIARPVRFHYLGGDHRDAVGRVESGTERSYHTLVSPWRRLGVVDRERFARLFNDGLYESAARVAEDAREWVDREALTGKMFASFAQLARGYQLWNCFLYREAEHVVGGELDGRFSRVVGSLEDPALATFAEAVGADRDRLRSLARAIEIVKNGEQLDASAQAVARTIVGDLLVQAEMLARLGRWDDAIARVYSALEKSAKIALLRFGIESSKVRAEQVPVEIRERVEVSFAKRDVVEVPLMKALRLLAELGDALGQRALEHKDELKKLLSARNHSLFVHGWSPVREKQYQSMASALMTILGESAPDTPNRATLTWEEDR